MEVGGMISASNRKNTVSESKMEMERDTWKSENEGSDFLETDYRYFDRGCFRLLSLIDHTHNP